MWPVGLVRIRNTFLVQFRPHEKRAPEVVVVVFDKTQILVEKERSRSDGQYERQKHRRRRVWKQSRATGEFAARNGRQDAKQRQRPVHSVEGEKRESRHERLRHSFFPADAEVERFQVLRKKPVEFE